MLIVFVRLSKSLLPKLALVFCVVALLYVTTIRERLDRFTAENTKLSALKSSEDVTVTRKVRGVGSESSKDVSTSTKEIRSGKATIAKEIRYDFAVYDRDMRGERSATLRKIQLEKSTIIGRVLSEGAVITRNTGGRLEDLNLRPLSVKYNGTPISEMYQPEFDVEPAVCPDDGSGVDVVVVIHSTPKDEDQRMAIRHTWGILRLRRGVVVVFLLGTSMDEALTRNARKESQTYGDIIVSRNVDSYNNLTLKTVAMAEWVSRRCPKARYFLKTDDDVFLNVPRFLEFLQMPEVSTAKRTIFGGLTRKAQPNRTPGHKYFISEEEYPGHTYVDYVQGSCYLVTGDLFRDLYQASLQSKFFRMEDVFFTGLMAEMVGARRVGPDNFSEVSYFMKQSPENPNDVDPCAVRGKIALHYVDREHMFRMWNYVLDRTLEC